MPRDLLMLTSFFDGCLIVFRPNFNFQNVQKYGFSLRKTKVLQNIAFRIAHRFWVHGANLPPFFHQKSALLAFTLFVCKRTLEVKIVTPSFVDIGFNKDN